MNKAELVDAIGRHMNKDSLLHGPKEVESIFTVNGARRLQTLGHGILSKMLQALRAKHESAAAFTNIAGG